MSFGGRPSVKIPPAADPVPTPEQFDRETLEKQRTKQRQRLAAAGRAGTILTEGSLGTPSLSKATLLGGG